jgi:hypothetical protein
MQVSYAEGTAINLQDAARDLDARLTAIESHPALHPALKSEFEKALASDHQENAITADMPPEEPKEQ